MTLILSGTDSSVSAPAVQGGTGGTTTGVYYPATNQLALATNGTQALLVDSSQNVGIGTASPSGKLHVAGGASNANFYLSNNSYSSYYYQNTGGSSGVSFPASQAYLWDSGGTERMRINSSGNVGIGTTNPIAKLSVSNGGAEGLEISPSGGTVSLTAYNRSGAAYAQLNLTGTAGIGMSLGPSYITTNSNMSVSNIVAVGGATPASSGSGISFPATQSASSDANTLDDYEEGTFTPTLTASTTGPSSVTYGNQQGRYTKIGRVVYVEIYLRFTAYSGGSGTAQIAGLPFTMAGAPYSGLYFQENAGFSVTGTYYSLSLQVNPSATIASILKLAPNSSSQGVDIAQITNSGTAYVIVSGCYTTT